jgi:hypothetical protein
MTRQAPRAMMTQPSTDFGRREMPYATRLRLLAATTMMLFRAGGSARADETRLSPYRPNAAQFWGLA